MQEELSAIGYVKAQIAEHLPEYSHAVGQMRRELGAYGGLLALAAHRSNPTQRDGGHRGQPRRAGLRGQAVRMAGGYDLHVTAGVSSLATKRSSG